MGRLQGEKLILIEVINKTLVCPKIFASKD